jgi:hypothetical protein
MRDNFYEKLVLGTISKYALISMKEKLKSKFNNVSLHAWMSQI